MGEVFGRRWNEQPLPVYCQTEEISRRGNQEGWRVLHRTIGVVLAAWCLLGVTGCNRHSDAGVTRLVDRFKQGMIKGSSAAKRNSPGPVAIWNFGESAATSSPEKTALGWTAGNGVAGLSQRDGRLKGRTTTDFPIIYVERPGKLDTQDLLYAIEIRLKVSKGTNVMAMTQDQVPLNFKELFERAKGLQQPWRFSSPIVASDNPQRYCCEKRIKI
jgi:hypothetical protein